jgi:hypothetical protein
VRGYGYKSNWTATKFLAIELDGAEPVCLSDIQPVGAESRLIAILDDRLEKLPGQAPAPDNGSSDSPSRTTAPPLVSSTLASTESFGKTLWAFLGRVNWRTALSPRVLFWAIVFALVQTGIVALPLSPILPGGAGQEVAGTIGLVVFLAAFFPVWLGYSVSASTVMACSYCHKRVKMGAMTCHHCGRHVAAST